MYHYRAGPKVPKGQARVFWGLDEKDYAGVAVVGLGKKNLGVNQLEEIHEGKENIRIAAAGRHSFLVLKYNFASNAHSLSINSNNDAIMLDQLAVRHWTRLK